MNAFARLALAGALVAGAPAVHADDKAWYVTALFGAAGQSDPRVELEDGSPRLAGRARMQAGPLAGAAVGYRYASGWRLEGEFAYQSVDHDGRVFGSSTLTGDGNFASTSVALNALYEFDLGGSPRVRSYLGAGLVYFTEIDFDVEEAAGERSFDARGDAALQLLAGARYRLGERLFLDAGLRYLKASSLRLDEEGGSRRLRADYAPYALTVGLGWQF